MQERREVSTNFIIGLRKQSSFDLKKIIEVFLCFVHSKFRTVFVILSVWTFCRSSGECLSCEFKRSLMNFECISHGECRR